MASHGGPRAVGSDGSDFTHREQIASRYQASTALKSKLKICAYVNLFLCLPQALFLVNSRLHFLSLPEEAGPRLCHYLLLATCLPSALYLASLPRNRKLWLRLADLGTLGCGLGGVAHGFYSYFSSVRLIILDGEYNSVLLYPVFLAVTWYIVFIIKTFLYCQMLFYSRQLMATWDAKKAK
ncbi:protein jagunal homolog 1-like [Acanthaster planci]|uniref:Protein jagunal homolog 1-like n=1 Tax=Acanthaster planci TaxID=133434 RepID=A0A8B7ZUN7_ACAPL|nr:protein jagunal homolog 1-like [Acanthaster planci]